MTQAAFVASSWSSGPAGSVGTAEVVGHVLDECVGLTTARTFTPLEVGAFGLRHFVGISARTAQREQFCIAIYLHHAVLSHAQPIRVHPRVVVEILGNALPNIAVPMDAGLCNRNEISPETPALGAHAGLEIHAAAAAGALEYLHANLCGEPLARPGGSEAVRRVINPPAPLTWPGVDLHSGTFEQANLVDLYATAAVVPPRLDPAR